MTLRILEGKTSLELENILSQVKFKVEPGEGGLRQQLTTHVQARLSFGLPRWFSGKEPTCQCKRHSFNSWVGEIPWRKKRQPTPALLPRKSHAQRSLMGYTLKVLQRVGHDLATKQ